MKNFFGRNMGSDGEIKKELEDPETPEARKKELREEQKDRAAYRKNAHNNFPDDYLDVGK